MVISKFFEKKNIYSQEASILVVMASLLGSQGISVSKALQNGSVHGVPHKSHGEPRSEMVSYQTQHSLLTTSQHHKLHRRDQPHNFKLRIVTYGV